MIALAFALSLVAQDSPAPVENIAAIRYALDSHLTDYPSARFRGVKLSEDGLFACGEVNARTPAGGYAGWRMMRMEFRDGQLRVNLADDLGVQMNFERVCNARDDWRTGDYSAALAFED